MYSNDEVLARLASEAGRRELHTYALTHQGHVDLTAVRAMLRNSFARVLLGQVLLEAAQDAVNADPAVLKLRTDERLPVLQKPLVPLRPQPRDLNLEDFSAFLSDLFKRYRVRVDDRSYALNTIAGNFHKYVGGVVATRPHNNAKFNEFLNMWSVFESLVGETNERAVMAKQAQARDEMLQYVLATTAPLPDFVSIVLHQSEGDWSEFLARGGASAGVLLTVAQKKTISFEAWETVMARAPESYRDALVAALAHPSLPDREAALMMVEAAVPFDLRREDLYSLIEVARSLPTRTHRHFMPAVRSTIVDNWHREEYLRWIQHGTDWGYNEAYEVQAQKPERARKRWWQQ